MDILKITEFKITSYLFWFSIIGINILLLFLIGIFTYYLIYIGNLYIENHKKLGIRKKHFYFFLIFGLIILLLAGIYSVRGILYKILSPIIWSIILAYLLNPIVHRLEKRKISRLWSVIIVYAGIILILTLFSITITPKIIKEAKNLVELLPKYTTQMYGYFNNIYEKVEQLDNFSPQLEGIKEPIRENLIKIQYIITNIVQRTTNSIFHIFSRMITLALIPIFSFYFLKDTTYFKKKIVFIIPKSLRNELINIFKDIDTLLSQFIRGQLIVAGCVGILSTIALLIIGVDFAFLIGMVAGISNIIPYIGPIIGAIPGVIFGLLDEPIKALWVIVAFTVIQQIESAILSPKIVGESVGLHPVAVIISLLIGNELLGVVGMLFAVPFTASIKIIGRHLMNFILKV